MKFSFFNKTSATLLSSLLVTSPLFSETNQATQASNEVGFNLWPSMTPSYESSVYSPFSISYCLSMITNGAEGVTKEELESALRWRSDRESIGLAFQNLNQTINSAGQNSSDQGFILKNANILFTSDTLEIRPSFQNFLEDYYAARVEPTDFSKPSQASKVINNWVADVTSNKIKELIDPSTIKPSTKAMLINAIYFQGKWLSPFKKNKTEKSIFRTIKQGASSTEVSMMHQRAFFKYIESDSDQIAFLPFKTDVADLEPALLIALPAADQNFHEWAKNLSNERIEKWLGEASFSKLDLKLPKFTIRQKQDLKKALNNLGIHSAFANNADFSSISDQSLQIDKVVHEAVIEVDEDGVEAAAATAISIVATSVRVPEQVPAIPFIADRPFAFFLVDVKTKTILFMGQFVAP